ncbi:MAG TPA: HEAT repeat domain-containing protein [Planctomycetota bacterium]
MRTLHLHLLALSLIAPLTAQDPTEARVDPVALAAHYAAVEAELRAAPPPADAIVAARRTQAIDLLRDYRLRGVFGRSQQATGARMPLFVDADGRRCAVAFLLDRTGREGLTLDIAHRCNGAWVVELTGENELTAWLAEHGLTAAEAARIQAPYVPSTPPPPPPRERPPVPEYKPQDANYEEPDARPQPSTPRPAASPPPMPGAGAVAKGGSSTRGIALAELQDSSWMQWWGWNRDHFEAPQARAVPEGATAATPIRTTAEQALVSLSVSSNSAERAAALQALGRMGAAPELLRKSLEDPSREVRFAALLGLGSAGSPAHTHTLISQTRNQPDEEALSIALTGLAMTPGGSLARTIGASVEPSLGDGRLEVFAAAAMASGPLDTPELRAKTMASLRTGKSPLQRAIAAHSLGASADDETVAALTIAAGERSVDVRRSAALALGRSHHALALPALQTAYELEHDQLTRAMLLLAIGDHGGLAAKDFLGTELAGGSKAIRGFAALALGLWGRARADESVAAPIQKALAAERNRDQRGAYLLALGMLRHGGSRDLLIGELGTGSTSATRGAAASALGMLGDVTTMAALTRCLREDSCPAVRSQAARSMTGLGQAAIETLRTAMREELNSEVRSAAAFALGGIAEPSVAVDLVELASDEAAPAAVRAGAALGLGRHFRQHDPRLPDLRFQQNYTVLPALVAWAFRQEL